MNHGHTKETLIAFTERVKAAFIDKRIHAPVHLNSETQAEPLLKIFESIRPQDWVFSTWRSTYHALLKDVPTEEVFDAILSGRSMYLQFRKYNFFSSAIVGGILPIALGVADGIRRNGGDELVWVFCGDMCCRTGLYHEFAQYAWGHQLPIKIVVEDNGLSTNANTEKTWGGTPFQLPAQTYRYERTTPHTGVGTHVSF